MAITSKMYGNAMLKALSKEINYIADDIKVMLCTSAYTPDQDVHAYKSSVTGEVTGTGYTAGGVSLSSKTMVYDNAANTITLDAADIVWTNSSITARYAVIYDNTPSTDAAKPLLGYVDMGQDMVSAAGNFTITWDAAGLFTVTTA